MVSSAITVPSNFRDSHTFAVHECKNRIDTKAGLLYVIDSRIEVLKRNSSMKHSAVARGYSWTTGCLTLSRGSGEKRAATRAGMGLVHGATDVQEK